MQNKIIIEAIDKINNLTDINELEKIRVEYLGKTGVITNLLKNLFSLSIEEKKLQGAELNQIKNQITDAIDSKKQSIENIILNKKLAEEKIDISLPPRPFLKGNIHPISFVIEEVTNIFAELGFSVAKGPDIEDDFHNFTALNIPDNHPARQMHDSFYFDNNMLLRTHTSSVQIREMKEKEPPHYFIVPGRTYRCDSDMTHTPMFHQIEGVAIDKNLTMAHLKGTIESFLKAFFGIEDLPIRFRPSFFPFTEPSAEVDIGYLRKDNEIIIGKGDSWLEILGCGMVHPQVLKNVGIDPEVYQGFAFGAGIERLAMLKYGIPDLRTFFDSDVRWLENYGFTSLESPNLTWSKVK